MKITSMHIRVKSVLHFKEMLNVCNKHHIVGLKCKLNIYGIGGKSLQYRKFVLNLIDRQSVIDRFHEYFGCEIFSN